MNSDVGVRFYSADRTLLVLINQISEKSDLFDWLV